MKLILSLFFFASIGAAQDIKLPFIPQQRKAMQQQSPSNVRIHFRGESDTSDVRLFNVYGDSVVVTRGKSERTVDIQTAPFSSVITTQDIKLPFTPKPRQWPNLSDSSTMQERSHRSAQKVGFRRGDSLCIKQTMPEKVGFVYFGLDTLQPPTDAEVVKRLLSHPSVNVFLQLYSRYEAECYADSMRTADEEWIRARGEKKWTRVYNPDAGKWTHRTPTFPGFIEYLRSQK